MADEKRGIVCPFCGHKEIEKINLHTPRSLRWSRTPFKTFGDAILPKKIDAYRCERCSYVMMFARD